MTPARAEAHCLHREFEAAPPASFRTPEHYLLYASSGRMRLTAEGRVWTLPPARAALIAADHPIVVTLVQRVEANCALFRPGFFSAPPSPLSVFEVTPLVRELLSECRGYVSSDEPLDEYGNVVFRALWAVATRLARSATPAVVPVPQSALMARAMHVLEADLASAPGLENLATQLATTSRSLARRFQSELGMTYREMLRRLRMIRAVEIMVDDVSAGMTEIALTVGYDSLSAFNAAFRDFAHMTPTEYRRSLASGSRGGARTGMASTGGPDAEDG